jgi:serine/threonine protein kinase
MSQGVLLDLVCGPASPLPETYQRYRLVAHLGSGGQADVFRAVRLCGGVTSAPMTVKVFRVDPNRPLADELRSWDKGDAALMDLNNRGVGGICRRADGFYGPPPHRPGERPAPGDAVPYQVYDYLHGVNLREYVVQRTGLAPHARRLNAVSALGMLAGVLRAIHYPQQTGATPVLHMDVKPSNVLVLATGEVRLIDFTGARYWRAEEITQIAYTPESGGPEAFGGAAHVGPAYDVHGFGAVAYFLVTGAYPRVDANAQAPGASSPTPWSVLRRHPVLESTPALRDHLHAPLADRPGDRPSSPELAAWVTRLAHLVRHADLGRAGAPDVGVDWSEPPDRSVEPTRASGRASLRPALTGTETEAFQRIERLERELVALRAAAGNGAGAANGGAPNGAGTNGTPPRTLVSPPFGTAPFGGDPPPAAPVSSAPVSAVPASAAPAASGPVLPPAIRGRATVPPPKPQLRDTDDVVVDPVQTPQPDSWRPPTRSGLRTLKRGLNLTVTGGFVAFFSWGIWAAATPGRLTGQLVAFSLVLVVAAGLFALTRLVGSLVLERRMGRVRRGAHGAHAVSGLFLAAAGVAYLGQTPWVMQLVGWLF